MGYGVIVMNFRTIGDLNSVIYKNLQKIPQDIDLVVGIPRSGMLAGSIISLLLNEPLADFNSLLNGEYHSRLDNMCFDIDGVLCEDPTPEQNDDGEKYVEFIRNAPVKVIPTYKIVYLVYHKIFLLLQYMINYSKINAK